MWCTVSCFFCLCPNFLCNIEKAMRSLSNLWECIYFNIILASDYVKYDLNCAFRFRVIITRLLQICCRQVSFSLSPWMVQWPSPLHMYLYNGFSASNFTQLQNSWIGQSMGFTLDLFLSYSPMYAFLVCLAWKQLIR